VVLPPSPNIGLGSALPKGLMNGIQELDVIVEGRTLIEEERVKREDFSKELERLLLYEEVSWR
jgi:hypothetical protein